MTTKTKNRDGSWGGRSAHAGRAMLPLMGLVALVCLGVGCGGGGPPPVCDDGSIATSWVLDEGGNQVECLGGDEVDLRIDTDQMIATFACSAHAGASPAVEGGVSHDVSLTLYDASNNILSATGHMSVFVPCGTTVQTPQVDFSL